ncbi:NusG domain II-containing protein [Clostridium sp. YIM B02515]|uniref:NusG domain II-containing protein n=1 Tax=Clostridium rhizosphaerae TaxID=2803861 RepID=A0ABS1T7B1_9CLOT|nr:NusG domain II-containing protein [Clostridium rhizosphaerae]MBL4935238.1 NusG domain II-containing protein [Clostridium rhizosphaerae]
MKLKPLDIVVIVVLLVIALGSSTAAFINSHRNFNNKYVEIEVKGKLFKKLPLDNSSNERITIDTDLGKNVIEISNGKVRISDADCRDQICIKDGSINKPGDILVCLPHKVVVQIKGENSDTDVLSF